MRQLIGLLAAAGVILVLAESVPGRDEGKKNNSAQATVARSPDRAVKVDVWMKAKQNHAQSIFAGLTEGDFEKIQKGASLMYGVGFIEKWLGDRDFAQQYAYEGQVNAFNYSLQELVRNAKAKDIDGALNSYITMSQTCVRCHRIIRDADTTN